MKTIYVAFDGTSFYTEKECIEYEKQKKYIVSFLNERGAKKPLSEREFDSEIEAKRFIADALHNCFKSGLKSLIRLSHSRSVVEFESTELSEVVPVHLRINGKKLDEAFSLVTRSFMK